MLYAIKHKNRVVLGPVEWDKKYFEKVLKVRYNIDIELSFRPPLTVPLIINEHTSIHEAIVNQPDIDPMMQAYYGPLWDVSSAVIVANYEVHDHTIETARNNFRAIAATERYSKEISNVSIEIQGIIVTVDTSREGRNIFFQKFMLMRENEVVNWKFPEGWLTLTKPELESIIQAGATSIQAAFDWEKSINNQIDSAETAEDLYAIEIVKKQLHVVEETNEANQ